ncbi:MAG: 6-carboxytetrahydropterin synthase [Myxococcales bacterium]|nr:6-carboxytetrahydropterin synthase [Myxococcales bacterium]MCB9641870.1 6-carboxytetrahydropterin synthase [Myxococcales bacterium]
MLEMSFQRRFEAGHRFVEGANRQSLCTQPHGHSWRVFIRLAGDESRTLDLQENTLIPFAEIKGIWHRWIDHHIDHCFFYNCHDPLLAFMLNDNPKGRHVVLPGDPTTEMIAVVFKAKLESFLRVHQPAFRCTELRIQETETNAIVFSGDPSQHLPFGEKLGDYWWERSDMSTHDLHLTHPSLFGNPDAMASTAA